MQPVRRAVHDCFIEANRQAAEMLHRQAALHLRQPETGGNSAKRRSTSASPATARGAGSGLGRQHRSRHRSLLHRLRGSESVAGGARRIAGSGMGEHSRFRPSAPVAAHPRGASSAVAYLCVGYVSEFPPCPDLETTGWERRESLTRLIHFDGWGDRDEQRAAALVAAAQEGDRE